MHMVIAECEVEYSGRLTTFLPRGKRLLMHKADGSFLIHSDSGSYKPLNWICAPCSLTYPKLTADDEEQGVISRWRLSTGKSNNKSKECLEIKIYQLLFEKWSKLDESTGLQKEAVEKKLQELLADNLGYVLGLGWKLVRREYPTPIGPVDLLVKDPNGVFYAIEVKRKATISSVEQLTRYLEYLSRQYHLSNAGENEIQGILAAQDISPQALILSKDRNYRFVLLDYDDLSGRVGNTLF